MGTGLTLRPADYAALLEHGQAEAPHEACGLLGGVGGVVRRVYRMENVSHSPWEYRMDPREQVRVMVEIENAGWELSGIYHSHPSGPPAPSASDVAQAYYPDSVYVILAPDAQGEWRGRAYRIDEGRVEEVRLSVVA